MVIASNLTSVHFVYKEKIVKKTSQTKEHSVHTNSESYNIRLGS